jgi:hypothetical protein
MTVPAEVIEIALSIALLTEGLWFESYLRSQINTQNLQIMAHF